MAVSQMMTEDITSLPENASIMDAAKFMTDMNVGSVIVVDGSKPMGILTDRDIMIKVMVEGKDPNSTTIRDIMVSPVATVSEDKDILDVTHMMSEKKVRRCPVVNSEGTLVGMIAFDDILISLGQEMQDIASVLKFETGK
jgi:signal-transduction protein with cAMP-binding, CBS, and nucleotidyltransferase domain